MNAVSALHGLEDNPEAVADFIGEEPVLEILELVEAERDEERFGKFHLLFPDIDNARSTSPEGFQFKQVGDFRFFARDYYQKHLEFFRAGLTFRARCLMAANRVGKTFSAGGYETDLPPDRRLSPMVGRQALPPPDPRLGVRQDQRDHPRHRADHAARRDRVSRLA
jgi:hypothetical protein